jgi:hypothetical protein
MPAERQGAVGFDRHAAAAPVPGLPAAQLRRDRFEVDRKARRHPFENRNERLAVRFAGGEKAQPSALHSIQKHGRHFCTVVATTDRWRQPCSSSPIDSCSRTASNTVSAARIDLATGAPVILTIGTAGGAAEQTRWSVRCDWLHRLHHRSIAPLVDFGIVGETSRFEAWCCT